MKSKRKTKGPVTYASDLVKCPRCQSVVALACTIVGIVKPNTRKRRKGAA